jgi:hypothetical protein
MPRSSHLSHSRLISSSSFSFSFKGDPTVLKLSAEIGWKALRDSVEQMGSGKFTELVWPLTAEDPDDAFSSIPYEKVVSLCLSLCVSLSLPLSSLSVSLPPSLCLSVSLSTSTSYLHDRVSIFSIVWKLLLGQLLSKSSPRIISPLTSSVWSRVKISKIIFFVSLLAIQRLMLLIGMRYSMPLVSEL